MAAIACANRGRFAPLVGCAGVVLGAACAFVANLGRAIWQMPSEFLSAGNPSQNDRPYSINRISSKKYEFQQTWRVAT